MTDVVVVAPDALDTGAAWRGGHCLPARLAEEDVRKLDSTQSSVPDGLTSTDGKGGVRQADRDGMRANTAATVARAGRLITEPTPAGDGLNPDRRCGF